MRKKDHEPGSPDFCVRIKITAVKKLVWNEVVFEEDQEKLDELSAKITNALRLKRVIPYDSEIAVGKTFKRAYIFVDSLGYICRMFEKLCKNLSKISEETKYGFIVNFSLQENYFEDGLGNFMQLGEINFHPEIILDGKMLLATSLNDIEAPLSYLNPYKDYLAPLIPKSDLTNEVWTHSTDDSYWLKLAEEEFLNKGFVHFAQVEKNVCLSMIDAIKRYFQLDYTLDVIYGTTNQDYDGLELPIKNLIAERF